jgi:hypothetical protein
MPTRVALSAAILLQLCLYNTACIILNFIQSLKSDAENSALISVLTEINKKAKKRETKNKLPKTG